MTGKDEEDPTSPKSKKSIEESLGLIPGDDEDTGPENITEHWIFTTIIMIGIVLNAIQMGMELQFEGGIWKLIWAILEHVFTVFFLVEFIIKLIVIGPEPYFEDKSNWIDAIVVIVAVIDNWILAFALADQDTSSMNVISILRLIRLSRILKLLKAKRELMMLIEGIFSSIRSMAWLSVLLGILVYTVAICFVQFIGRTDVYDDDDFDNKKYFGDMVKASVTGTNLALLLDWPIIFRPILKRQPHLAVAVGMYVGVASFGIMNAIIGVIVARTSAAAKAAEEEDNLAFMKRQMAFVEDIGTIIYEIDTDGDGTVSREELEEAGDNEGLMDALCSVELPAGFDMLELHCMLDKDGDGELTKSEFQQGMRRLIFSNDFQRQCLMMLAVAQQKRKLCSLRSWLETEFENFGKKFEAMPDIIIEKVQEKFDGMIPEPPPPGEPTMTASDFEKEFVCTKCKKKKVPTRPATLENPHEVPMKIDFRRSMVTIQTEDIPEFITDAGTVPGTSISKHLNLPSEDAWPKSADEAPPIWSNPQVNLIVNAHLRPPEPLPGVVPALEGNQGQAAESDDSDKEMLSPVTSGPESSFDSPLAAGKKKKKKKRELRQSLRETATDQDATGAPSGFGLQADAGNQPLLQDPMSNDPAAFGGNAANMQPMGNNQQQPFNPMNRQAGMNNDVPPTNAAGMPDNQAGGQTDPMATTWSPQQDRGSAGPGGRRVGPPPARPRTSPAAESIV